MMIKQISVFVENKPGKLSEITDFLGKNNVDIRALSIADTTDYGILRIIVPDAENVAKMVKKQGFTVSVTDVIALRIENKPGGLAVPLHVLAEEGIGVEYIYAFLSHKDGEAYVVMRIDNIEKAQELLQKKGFTGIDSI